MSVEYQHVDAASMFFVSAARAVRRHRDRQPVRRHPDRPGRGHRRRHRPGRERQHQPDRGLPRRCSSRCTAARRTSPGSPRPTRPRRSCPRRCSCAHLGLSAAAAKIEQAVADDVHRAPGAVAGTDYRGDRRRRRQASIRIAANIRHIQVLHEKGTISDDHKPRHRDRLRDPPVPDAGASRRTRAGTGGAGVRSGLHRSHDHPALVGRARLARRQARAVRPVRARPGHGGVPLRPGALRGAQGLPRRTAGRS